MNDGRHRTALALHGLDASDRDWLLAQLPIADRDGVEALLGELRELGIPPEPVPAEVLHTPAASPSPATPQERVALAPAARVAAILAGEPCALVAHFLGMQTPARRDELLHAMPRRLRPVLRAKTESLAGGPRAERLEAAIVAAIEARLDAPPERSAAMRLLEHSRERWRGMAGRWSNRRAA